MERLSIREGVKEMPPMERPREKFRRLGADALSDVELLAMLMGSGTAKFPVLEMCENLLAAAGGSLRKLTTLDLETLCGVEGIGEVRAMSFLATLALAKRVYCLPAGRVVPYPNEAGIAEFLTAILTPLHDDGVVVILLTGDRELIATVEVVGSGSVFPEIAYLIGLVVDSAARRFFLACKFGAGHTDNPAVRDFCSKLRAAANMMRLEFEGWFCHDGTMPGRFNDISTK